MNGREKCRTLKSIRVEIARKNDIDLEIRDCTYQGDCRGTCPQCERELRYLESELDKRRRLKKGVVLAGISASLALTLSGCTMLDSLKSEWITPDDGTLRGAEVDLLGEVAPMPTDELETAAAAFAPVPMEKEPLNRESSSAPEARENE